MHEGHLDHAGIIQCYLFEQRVDSSAFLEPTDQAFIDVPIEVDFRIKTALPAVEVLVRVRRNHGLNSHRLKHRADPLRAIAFVTSNLSWPCDEAPLGDPQHRSPHTPAESQRPDLHALFQPSTQTPTDGLRCRRSNGPLWKNRLWNGKVHGPGVRVNPLFNAAPAQRAARITVQSICQTSCFINPAWTNADRSRFRISSSRPFEFDVSNRSQTVPYFSNCSGRSRQGAPVRMIQNMPLTPCGDPPMDALFSSAPETNPQSLLTSLSVKRCRTMMQVLLHDGGYLIIARF